MYICTYIHTPYIHTYIRLHSHRADRWWPRRFRLHCRIDMSITYIVSEFDPTSIALSDRQEGPVYSTYESRRKVGVAKADISTY